MSAKGGAGCASCHLPPTFALAADARSNGLDAGETRLFKAPSLRGVGLTGPYMHDGRFATLEEVVDFYASGVRDGPALDPRDCAKGRAAPPRPGCGPTARHWSPS
jgi:cytochrome c peroxidase